ncbi:nitrite reductase [Ekhidna sp.]
MSINTLSKESENDILELQNKIKLFHKGEIPEERFKAYRLTRGVYGQRQSGVQMFRIKLPYGKISPNQLRVIADISDQYSNRNLHLTTRQNIQLHYVKLEDSPAIWTLLEGAGVTARESCGNTVRNITASPYAGIDPNEPFDVSPYVQATFEYFLRNPICQDMGRKIKMAFSSSEQDSAFTFIHDLGFIPRIKDKIRGFKIVIGGGLGAQPFIAQTATEFIPEDELIPFIEASLRVFDRYGEREKRNKARLKYLIEPRKGLGVERFLELVEEEKKSLPFKKFPISSEELEIEPESRSFESHPQVDIDAFKKWKSTNVFEQKQTGYYGVQIRVPLGNISPEDARKLASIAEDFASNDIRITINQGLLFRYVREEALIQIFHALKDLGLDEPGFDTLVDITSCPGTDTCNLGVTNSTQLATKLEHVVREEYPQLIDEANIKVKISGCMNSCGQHMIANIGFHGSSIKVGDKVAPAMQVVIGGGVSQGGEGFIAEKVIKVPTRRAPQVLRSILDDYEEKHIDGEYFNDYYQRNGKKYFYGLLKPIVDKEFNDNDFIDWGKSTSFLPDIGVGECAGVMVDLVGTILDDARDNLVKSQEAFNKKEWAYTIFFGYNTFIIGAKALLLAHDIQCNTHKKILEDFEELIRKGGWSDFRGSFSKEVLAINQNEPSEAFAGEYLNRALEFFEKVENRRSVQDQSGIEKSVIVSHYKA